MPKIKLTKSELKTQRDALKQFQRFLPTLQLKKQQLQVEIRKIEQSLRELEARRDAFFNTLAPWVALFADKAAADKIYSLIKIDRVVEGSANIAGVIVPVFVSVSFTVARFDIFAEEPWIPDAIAALKEIIEIEMRLDVAKREYSLVSEELRVTSQRVNLFEKVKIPESKENIRVIQIFLGDQNTAGVGRSKIAKRKMQVAV